MPETVKVQPQLGHPAWLPAARCTNAVVGHMRRPSKLPDRVRSFFGHRTFRYAA